MNNLSRSICGVENGTSFYDVSEHEYDPQTSECVPFAASAPLMLKFASYFTCTLASVCAFSIFIVSVLLISLMRRQKIRKQNSTGGIEKSNGVLLQCCFCIFGFMGSLMMAVSASKRLYYVCPLDTVDGVWNIMIYTACHTLNLVAQTSYALTFKEIRISSVVVPLISLPSAHRIIGLELLFLFIILVSLSLSLANGLITDPFSYSKFLFGWAIPIPIVFGIAVPDVMLPVLKSMDAMLSSQDESSVTDAASPHSNSSKLEKAKSLGIIQEKLKEKKSSRLSSYRVGHTTVNRKAIENARLLVSRIRKMIQITCAGSTILTILLVTTTVVYKPYLVLFFQLNLNVSELAALLVMLLPIYRNITLHTRRVSQTQTIVPMNSTIMGISAIEHDMKSIQCSFVDEPKLKVHAEKPKDEFY